MPDLPVAGPLRELHVGHEPRLDPMRAFPERPARRRVERRVRDLERREEFTEFAPAARARSTVLWLTGGDYADEPVDCRPALERLSGSASGPHASSTRTVANRG
jgi:hypothetical protein